MFCFQCEQTDRSGATPGCSVLRGICGKDENTADLQDVLVHAVQGIAQYNQLARRYGVADDDASAFELFALFTTLTNVNFNATKFVGFIQEAAAVRDRVRAAYEAAARAAGDEPAIPAGPAQFAPTPDTAGLLAQAAAFTVRPAGTDPNVVGLRALCLYGLKGVCAYAHHAMVLDKTDPAIYAGIEDALAFLAGEPTDIDELLARALSIGTINLSVMELLDAANTGRFGIPEPTAVRVRPVAGKAILVSGHDLRDLAAVLEATDGTGVNVYTHGELLPANAYPQLKKYSHLVGNFGGAWQDQQSDFARFPGAIVMTSNCLIEPLPSYRQRIFTTGPVGWPGVRHLEHDFAPAVQAAKALPGFAEDGEDQAIMVGFGRDAVLSVADAVIAAVKGGQLRHFFLIGGCDGAAPGRNYYTDFALSTPADTAVLTLGCAKYRFNDQDFGSIGAIPRLLDIGQCNDSFSAIKIALALADAFECGVNELPLTLVISWFEQKATAVLLTLLSLGIRNIKLGPTLPVYLTDDLIGVLVEKFGIGPIGDAGQDIAAALART
ncbi:MAG: hydroxylamine reductase [Frankiaceae bacterium]|jgi:hydroxylamine reductase|nr:hydroxylamine reductase [Frankiaceae bacterium]